MSSLCYIARKTLESYFENKKFEPDEKTEEKCKEKKACFVTLTKNGELFGCIGCLETEQELWKNVQENVINAAFHDPRFSPLQKQELENIKIEISVLSKPQKLSYENEEDLLNQLNKKMGLILRIGFYSSTFLPQVWEEIPDNIQFLEQLSLKAGLEKNTWKKSEIYFYTVEIEKE